MWVTRKGSHQQSQIHTNISILGKGTDFKGNVTFDATLRIDGRVEGEIHTTGTLIVGEHAVIKGSISAGVLMHSGKIKGKVTAIEKVHILKPGILIGDVQTPVFTIEEGSHFHGMCDMSTHHWSGESVLSIDLAPDVLVSTHSLNGAAR
jgi:cytoskeletal protein CcmA (bactofilin family)